ncbi:MAG TPA: S8 family peptidase [Erysipelothrix sp.]
MDEKKLNDIESAYVKLIVKPFDFKNVIKHLEDLEIAFEKIHYFSDVKRIKIKSEEVDKLHDLAITIAPLPIVTHFGNTVEDGDQTEIKRASEHPLKIRLGLLDTGIKSQYQYQEFIHQEIIPELKDQALNLSHGTFIAGQWLYQREPFLALGASIYAFPIVTTKKETEDIILKRLIKIVANNPQIKVWNIAISVSQEIEEKQFSDMALVLDYLQREYDCIISKTVANNFTFLDENFKMHQGADSVEALTVGSINRHNHKRSAFSRIGPGPLNINKPDLVYYGGDVHKNEEHPITKASFQLDGIKSLAATTGLRKACGSSFASPIVSKVAAEVWASMPQLTRHEVKAYLIHNSYATEHHQEIGFGKLAATQAILNSINRIYKQRLRLVENEIYQLSLNPKFTYQITLVSDPQLDFSDPKNYIQSWLAIKEYDESKSPHKSLQIKHGDTLTIQCQGGTTNAILLVEQI